MCNGGYFSETSLHPRIPPARPRDPVIHIKPQAPKARGCCLIRIQVRNKEQSLSVTGVTLVKRPYTQESRQQDPVTL